MVGLLVSEGSAGSLRWPWLAESAYIGFIEGGELRQDGSLPRIQGSQLNEEADAGKRGIVAGVHRLASRVLCLDTDAFVER
jgi:hypothetical protein